MKVPRICPNLDCENGEIFNEDDPIVTCPDCHKTLEEFSTDIEEEEEPEEDEEDWDDSVAGYDDVD